MNVFNNKVNLMSDEEMNDPSISASKLLNGDRIYKYELYEPPFYILSRYEDLNYALREPDIFIEGFGNGPNFVDSKGVLSDGEHHTLIRRIVQPNFLMGSIARLQNRLEEITEELLDDVEEMDEWDIHDNLSFPLPVIIICEILGIPIDDIHKFKRWADASVEQMCSEDPHSYDEELKQLEGYLLNLILKKRNQVEDDTLLSRISHAKIGKDYLSNDEAVKLTIQIFVAGNETTTSLISNLLWRMMTIDNLWERFVDGEIDIKDAITESLRYDPPLLGLFKTTSKEVNINGNIIPKKTKVMMHYGAANRDPKVFNNPNIFDINRDGSKVISFSLGVHICLGRELAKLETRVALNAIKNRFPNIRLLNDGERVGPFLFWGRKKLPVTHK